MPGPGQSSNKKNGRPKLHLKHQIQNNQSIFFFLDNTSELKQKNLKNVAAHRGYGFITLFVQFYSVICRPLELKAQLKFVGKGKESRPKFIVL